MSQQIILTEKIEKSLPVELVALVNNAVALAGNRNLPLYLVGGIVRDLLLGQINDICDLDLVVEGDAVRLAGEFAEKVGGRLMAHLIFNTAKIELGKWTIDIAMARTETYAKPGALPVVTAGTLKTDLFRRDFTINAMAISLNPDNYGELVDLYGGLKDLNNQSIRILHDKSFTDDATRIWRAIRYEQRLGFEIEPETLSLLKKNVPLMKTVGGYRLRHELELVLKEKEPEKALRRAAELGVLTVLHPSLKVDDWLVSQFRAARQPGKANPDYYLGLLLCHLNAEELQQITRYLRFSARQIKMISEIRGMISN
ncbi:MAG: CCA tRNA nucleotidyltransferase [Dehalococcoidales bacterium]